MPFKKVIFVLPCAWVLGYGGCVNTLLMLHVARFLDNPHIHIAWFVNHVWA